MPKKYQQAKSSKKVQKQNSSNNCGDGSSKNTQQMSKVPNIQRSDQKRLKGAKKGSPKVKQVSLDQKSHPKFSSKKF